MNKLFALLFGLLILFNLAGAEVVVNSTEIVHKPECDLSTFNSIWYYRPTNISNKYIECRSLGMGIEKYCALFSKEASCCTEPSSIQKQVVEKRITKSVDKKTLEKRNKWLINFKRRSAQTSQDSICQRNQQSTDKICFFLI